MVSSAADERSLSPSEDSVSNRLSVPVSSFPLRLRNSTLLGFHPSVATLAFRTSPNETTGVDPRTTDTPSGGPCLTPASMYWGTGDFKVADTHPQSTEQSCRLPHPCFT